MKVFKNVIYAKEYFLSFFLDLVNTFKYTKDSSQ